MHDTDAVAGEPKIDAVVVRQLEMPIEPPIRSGIHHITGIHTVFVELQAEGVLGVGYAFAFTRYQAATIRALAVELGDLVRAGSPCGVRAHWEAMWAHTNFIGHEGPATMAMAAIDTALWDLLARTAGMPLYRLLGAATPATAVYAAGGWLSWPLEDVVEEAQSFQAARYDGYKMRIGSPNWKEDVRRVYAVREAVGPDFALMADVNQAWSVETCLRAGRELEAADLAWLEEPVNAQDLAGSRRVADALDTPVAVGETVWGRRGFQQLLDAEAGDVIQLDLMRCGGVTEFLAITALVETRRLPMTSHLFTPISAHLMAATNNAYMIEHLPAWFDPMLEEQPVIEGGKIRPTDSPGIGLTISQSAIARWEVS